MHIRPNVLLQRRAIATLTLLAMLVAPLCASLCGSRACASFGSTQSEDCHSSVTASDTALRIGLAAVGVCGLQEFPAAALNDSTSSRDRMKQDSVQNAPSNLAPSQYVQRPVSGTSNSFADDQGCSANTSVQSTVLRV